MEITGITKEESHRICEQFKDRMDSIKGLFGMMMKFEIETVSDVPGYPYRVRNVRSGDELCLCKSRTDAEMIVKNHEVAMSHVAMGMAMDEQKRNVEKLLKEKEAERVRGFCMTPPEDPKPNPDATVEKQSDEPKVVPSQDDGFFWQMPPVVSDK